MPVTVDVLDAAGRAVPTADTAVTFAIAGGRIIGVGNGDPNSPERDKANGRRLDNGLAQVIVQAPGAEAARRPARMMLRATAPGVAAAMVTVTVLPPERSAPA